MPFKFVLDILKNKDQDQKNIVDNLKENSKSIKGWDNLRDYLCSEEYIKGDNETRKLIANSVVSAFNDSGYSSKLFGNICGNTHGFGGDEFKEANGIIFLMDKKEDVAMLLLDSLSDEEFLNLDKKTLFKNSISNGAFDLCESILIRSANLCDNSFYIEKKSFAFSSLEFLRMMKYDFSSLGGNEKDKRDFFSLKKEQFVDFLDLIKDENTKEYFRDLRGLNYNLTLEEIVHSLNGLNDNSLSEIIVPSFLDNRDPLVLKDIVEREDLFNLVLDNLYSENNYSLEEKRELVFCKLNELKKTLEKDGMDAIVNKTQDKGVIKDNERKFKIQVSLADDDPVNIALKMSAKYFEKEILTRDLRKAGSNNEIPALKI